MDPHSIILNENKRRPTVIVSPKVKKANTKEEGSQSNSNTRMSITLNMPDFLSRKISKYEMLLDGVNNAFPHPVMPLIDDNGKKRNFLRNEMLKQLGAIPEDTWRKIATYVTDKNSMSEEDVKAMTDGLLNLKCPKPFWVMDFIVESKKTQGDITWETFIKEDREVTCSIQNGDENIDVDIVN